MLAVIEHTEHGCSITQFGGKKNALRKVTLSRVRQQSAEERERERKERKRSHTQCILVPASVCNCGRIEENVSHDQLTK